MSDLEYENLRLAEQSLLTLKTGLSGAVTGLANLKDRHNRKTREADNNRRLAEDLERQAIAFLEKARLGQLDQAEADRLAAKALLKKQDHVLKQELAAGKAEDLTGQMAEFQDKVDSLKTEIRQFENQLLNLKARARAAAAALKAGQIAAEFDPGEAEFLLSRLQARVEDEEALAQAYEEMAEGHKDLDREIDRALGQDPDQKAGQALEQLKKDLKI